MTCFHPIKAWQRPSYPIKANQDEKKLHQLNKLSFKFIKDWTEITLPCGKCMGCILDRASDWATRVQAESKQWKNNCFVTLTYNENGFRKNGKRNLPITSRGVATLQEKDVQNFLKRLRKQFKGIEEWKNPNNGKIEKPIRYFYCGEYGIKNHRPHYHMAIFNWVPPDMKFYKNSPGSNKPLYTSKILQELWGYGFTPIGSLTYESASYIARYVQKKAYKKPTKKTYKDEIQPDGTIKSKEIKDKNAPAPEYIRMSRGVGIGINQWLKNKENIKKNNGIIIWKDNIKVKPIPRYFKKQWEKENLNEYLTHIYKQKQKIEEQKTQKAEKINIPAIFNWNEIKFTHQNIIDEQTLIEKSKKLKRNL